MVLELILAIEKESKKFHKVSTTAVVALRRAPRREERSQAAIDAGKRGTLHKRVSIKNSLADSVTRRAISLKHAEGTLGSRNVGKNRNILTKKICLYTTWEAIERPQPYRRFHIVSGPPKLL